MLKFPSQEAYTVFMNSTHQSFQLLYRILYTKSLQRYCWDLLLEENNILKKSTGTFKLVWKYLKVNSLSLIIIIQTPYYFSLAVFHTSDNFSHRVCLKRLLPFTLKSSKAVHCSVHRRQHGTKSTRQREGVKIFQTVLKLEQPKVSFFSCSQKQLFLYQVTSDI